VKFIWAILFLSFCSCAGAKLHKELTSFEKEFNHHTGLLIYDTESKKEIFSYNADKYFTPASNTKVLTLYASIKILGDSVPALNYYKQGDSLIFWGTGDPTLLYPYLPVSPVYNFLKSRQEDLYFSDQNFDDTHFGPGWAWEDYDYDYSVERSSLPLYGNALKAVKFANDGYLKVEPTFFKPYFWLADSAENSSLTRIFDNNAFIYTPSKINDLDKSVPFKVNGLLTARILSDTLNRPVRYLDMALPIDHQVLYGIPTDTLYQEMIQESDNFIAEQLMLLCSGVKMNLLSVEKAIQFAKENYMQNMPDQPVWKDGSGLSRYNLITPRSLVWLWGKILEEKPKEKLFPLLATGGVSGTLQNYFKADQPYIFGKTGTLSNTFNLSGFLITKKGKLFIFSFMNNSYPTRALPVKKKMEEILWEVHLNN
jgi:D-alanyl-D-alanine carboxypeptidase/D-alanyl-D-alanine-endopeptidase (penicillin-binding protein 4)